MNKLSIIVSAPALASALFVTPAMAVVPVVDGGGVYANINCKPAVTATGGSTLVQPVLHFDKIIFAINTKLQAKIPNDQANLDKIPLNTELDIKVRDNPATVADLKAKVLSFLGAVSTPQFYPAIRIINVAYAVTVCPK